MLLQIIFGSIFESDSTRIPQVPRYAQVFRKECSLVGKESLDMNVLLIHFFHI